MMVRTCFIAPLDVKYLLFGLTLWHFDTQASVLHVFQTFDGFVYVYALLKMFTRGFKILQMFSFLKWGFSKIFHTSKSVNKSMTGTLKFVYFLYLWIYLSAAWMEPFLTWESHLRNSSQTGDDNQGSKVLRFGYMSTSHPRDSLIKKFPLWHFRLFFKQLKKVP